MKAIQMMFSMEGTELIDELDPDLAAQLREDFKPHSCVVDENGQCKPIRDQKMGIPGKGLTIEGDSFYFNGKPFRILSGEFHYFRVHPGQWGDRLLKMKAAGLNTVTTYVPWNLHERIRGRVDLISEFDLGMFIKQAEKVGLKVIIRPGPYICAEWDWGGMPSWLLQDPNMTIRTMYDPFIQRVDKYFEKLMPLLAAFSNGRNGPIIAFQIENEYGSYSNDQKYLEYIRDSFLKWEIQEVLFTSDGPTVDQLTDGGLPGILKTINFKSDPEHKLEVLKSYQPGKPVMVTEFWTGWFDHWGEHHHIMSPHKFEERVSYILSQNASINFYMFVGGTNFEFFNGANINEKGKYSSTITSYDYDSPIAETGDITDNFLLVRKLLKKLHLTPWDMPEIPANSSKIGYGKVELNETMSLEDMFNCTTEIVKVDNPLYMENMKNFMGSGQSFGWILYRHVIIGNLISSDLGINGSFFDRMQVFFNGKKLSTFERGAKIANIKLPSDTLSNNIIDIMVENMGRSNFKYELDDQRKGLEGKIYLGKKLLTGWESVPFDFGPQFIKGIGASKRWKPLKNTITPSLYRGYFKVPDRPMDTFLSMQGWNKGFALVNGWPLGRYWKVGPQQTLYVPNTILVSGWNQVVLFEVEQAQKELEFVGAPSLGAPKDY